MSKSIRQTALSGLFGSKRFIVSVCAAIAMVLGALSVGASIFVPQSAAETQQEQAANSPVFTERRTRGNATTTREDGSIFTNQQTLVPNIIQQKTNGIPISVTPSKAKAGLSIEFGPVNASAGISLGSLQVKIDPALTPTIEVPILPSTPVEPPIVETEPPADPPKEEQPTDPTPPIEGQSSASGMGAMSTDTTSTEIAQ